MQEAPLAAFVKQVVEQAVQSTLALQEGAPSASNGSHPSSPYLAVSEAADYLRCKPQRIYDLLSAGRLKRYRDGTRVLLKRDEVAAHVEPESR